MGDFSEMRRLVLVSSLAAFGLAVAEPAAAQYSYPAGPNRGVIAAEPDDDEVLPPGQVSRRASDPAIDSQSLPPLTGRGTYPYDLHPRVSAPSGALPPPPDRPYVGSAPGQGPAYNEPPSTYASPPPGTYAPPPAGPYASQPHPGYPAAPGYGAAPQGAAPYNPPYGPPYGVRQDDAGIPRPPVSIESGRPGIPGTTGSIPQVTIAALPPEDQPEVGKPKELPPQFRRQVVNYQTKHPAGTIIIDTPSTFLYYVNGDGTAIRYGIGVGREGFTWSGTEKITRMAEWPDWHPPAEMIERQPYLPRFMAGGESNPMGARALYLGKTVYRVHGTNQPSTIGQFVSSGCIRMLNEDVMDLYSRVKVGTKVVVLGDGKEARNTAR